MEIKRGDIFFADLSDAIGSEQSGCRPVLIVQNNKGNTYAPTVIVAPISSRMHKASFPTHVILQCLNRSSFVELEQIRTIDKCRLKDYMGQVDDITQKCIDNAIRISLAV